MDKFYPSTNRESFEFKVFDNPKEMYEKIKKLNEKYPSRLIASYTRDHEWISKKDDEFVEDKYDFDYPEFDFKIRWNMKTSKRSFAARKESIDEVGCVYTIQGTDLDYAGVIIGKELAYRDGKIVILPEKHAKKDSQFAVNVDKERTKAIRLIRNQYYVLLTRARRGTFVYCEDKALNEYLKTLIV